LRVLLPLLATAILAGGCGGNTSVYFCSGSAEFCDRTRQFAEEDTDGNDSTPTTVDQSAGALAIARTTPRVIEKGLEASALKDEVEAVPDMVGGWLLVASLGLLVDGTDAAAAARFYDQNRYWLGIAPPVAGQSSVLDAGLKLLASVSAESDPAVAEAAGRLVRDVQFETADTPLDGEAARASLAAALRMAAASAAGSDCCTDETLAAAAVVLCDALRSDPPGNDSFASDLSEGVSAGCSAAGTWLGELRRTR